MSFKLYAFKSKERKELLRDHVKAGLRAIKELYVDEGYHRHVARRMASIGVELEPWEAEAIIYIAYIYHDSGKAMEPLQSMIREGHGAPGHEALSAYLAGLALKEWHKLPEDVDVSIPLAILLHMSGLRHFLESIDVLWAYTRLSFKSISKIVFKMTREAVQEFNLIVSDSWRIDIHPPIIRDRIIMVRCDELSKFVKSRIFDRLPYPKHGRLEAESARRWLLTYMILHPLLIADEYAVAENTGQRPRPWAREFIDATKALHSLRRMGKCPLK